MTVKAKVGRVRYVAFRCDPPATRPALSGALPATARLTRFDGTYGIVKCSHRDRDALLTVLKGIERLGSKEVRVTPLRTSGTIKGAARALPASSEASRKSPPKRD